MDILPKNIYCIKKQTVEIDENLLAAKKEELQWGDEFSTKYRTNLDVHYFRAYLRIPTMQPRMDYKPAIKFLKEQAVLLDMDIDVYYPVNQRNPVILMHLPGQKPDLPGLLLNSHMDTAAINKNSWSQLPFGGDMDDHGRIVSSGAQDCKCNGMWYLSAIRAMQNEGIPNLERSVYVSFVPDTLNSGRRGMKSFVRMPEFRELNIGFAIDSGLASQSESYTIFYAERSVWRICFHITGTRGHSGRPRKLTTGAKLNYLLTKLMEVRASEIHRLKTDEQGRIEMGEITTINLMYVTGGLFFTLLPNNIEAYFEIRFSLDMNLEKFEETLNEWCEECGGGITIEYLVKNSRVPPTQTDPRNMFWTSFKRSMKQLQLPYKMRVFPYTTDNLHLRTAGIQTIGFTPINNVPLMSYRPDEYIDAETFLKGINIFKTIFINFDKLKRQGCN